jgi:hypothetical protein
MLRVPVNKSYLKRTIRPRLGWSQATPVPAFLDPQFDAVRAGVPIYPGMALMKTVGECVAPLNADGVPYGLSAFYEGGEGIFEISEQGINACAVWVLSEQADFEILAPAFDATVPWVEPVDGSIALVHAYTAGPKRGQLCPAGLAGLPVGTTVSTLPVARLLKVAGPQKIIVGGLQARSA